MDSLWTPRNITWIVLWSNRLTSLQNNFSYFKMSSMQCRKIITVKDNQKITQIYIPTSYLTRMTQNKKDSIKSILQHGRVVEQKLLCGIFYFRIFILDPVATTYKVATTYFTLSTKKNWNIWIWKNLLLLNPPQITRNNIGHCDQWEIIRTIILSYLSGIFQIKWTSDAPVKKYSCEWWWYKTDRK